MKGIICLVICAMLMLLVPACLAEGFDVSAMDLPQLYAAREAINARISALEHGEAPQTYDSGTYLVGEGIPEGDYVLEEAENAMFASVEVRTGSTENSDLLSHHLINNRVVIRLTAGAWVTLTEARARPLSQAALIEEGTVYEGGYLVGKTLMAGEYIADVDEKAPLSSYSVYDNILGTGAQLIKFEVIHGPVEIALDDGEYIELSGCSLTRSDDVDGGM